MTSPAEKRLYRVVKRYSQALTDRDYLELYWEPDPWGPEPIKVAFASIHQRLDAELDFMNRKASNGESGHFNAENSRSLIGLIKEVEELKVALERAGKELAISPEYERALSGSSQWLESSNGSPIPEGFTPINIDMYDPIFSIDDQAIELTDSSQVELIMVGEGAFALVHKFIDPNYGLTIARKKLKKVADSRDIERFRREYEIMKDLDFPYILKVHQFNDSDNSYTMEFCENTLEEYIKRRNSQRSFDFGVRRRIALQFLYGLNYLHFKGICHRDLSYKNILLRVYAEEAAIVKLSDFGLAKPEASDFTKTETEIRGTYVDPTLDTFKGFQPVNDIWVVGLILSFIFTGRKNLLRSESELAGIVQKCSHSDPTKRYQTVAEIIAAVEKLVAPLTAEAPA